MFNLFKKKKADYFGDLAKSVNKKVDEKINSDFYQLNNKPQIESDKNKILLLTQEKYGDKYFFWYKKEVQDLIENSDYLKMHIMSVIIAFFAFINDDKYSQIPKDLAGMSTFELFYKEYIACLAQRELKSRQDLE